MEQQDGTWYLKVRLVFKEKCVIAITETEHDHHVTFGGFNICNPCHDTNWKTNLICSKKPDNDFDKKEYRPPFFVIYIIITLAVIFDCISFNYLVLYIILALLSHITPVDFPRYGMS